MPVTGEKRSYRSRREYLLRAVQLQRKKIRQLAIAYKGGKCSRCGYDRCLEALEFHHISSDSKDFGISARGHSRSWERTKAELNKCVLLCANGHREIHARIISPE